jgi:phage gp45-like
MAGLMKIDSARVHRRAETPGATVECAARDALRKRTIEMMHPPGVLSIPAQGDIAITVDAGGRLIIAVGSRNYKVSISITEGETAIYSTDKTGANIKALIVLTGDGEIKLNGGQESMIKYGPLEAALSAFAGLVDTQLKALGQPGASLDISAAEAPTVRTG